MRLLHPAVVVVLLLFSQISRAQISITVPSKANIFLAGMPAGTKSAGNDIAPNESPYLVPVRLSSGQWLEFSNLTGTVSFDPPGAAYGPEGKLNEVVGHSGGAENGKSAVYAPIDGLIGVFLDDTIPSGVVPPTLSFSTSGARNYRALRPALRQIFYIGDGHNDFGIQQRILVPTGATRLYLGPMDGYSWNNNIGSFTGQMKIIPKSVVMDLNGDNLNDLLLQNSVTGTVDYWLLNGSTITAAGIVSNGTDNKWKVVATPDINSDDSPDILLQYQSAGAYAKGSVQYWKMNGTTIAKTGILWNATDTNWQLVTTMQINGVTVAILQHAVNGTVYYWTIYSDFTIGPSGFIQSTNIPDWKVVAHPDWMGDGMPTFLLQNQTNGSLYYWNYNLNMTRVTTGYLYNGNLGNWKVVGTPDINRDGMADILFQDPTTGAVFCWLLGASHQIIGGGYLWQGGDANWKIKCITDLTNSNTVSLVFQNSSTGAVIYWNLNGAAIGSLGYVFNGSLPNWNLISLW